jgi:hypothetical protein
MFADTRRGGSDYPLLEATANSLETILVARRYRCKSNVSYPSDLTTSLEQSSEHG